MPTVKEIKTSNIYHPTLKNIEELTAFIKTKKMADNAIFLAPSAHELFFLVVYVQNNTIHSGLIAAFTEEPTDKHRKAFHSLTKKSEDDFDIDVLIAPLEAKQSLKDFKELVANLTLTSDEDPRWQFCNTSDAKSASTAASKSTSVANVSLLKRSNELSNLHLQVTKGRSSSPTG